GYLMHIAPIRRESALAAQAALGTHRNLPGRLSSPGEVVLEPERVRQAAEARAALEDALERALVSTLGAERARDEAQRIARSLEPALSTGSGGGQGEKLAALLTVTRAVSN